MKIEIRSKDPAKQSILINGVDVSRRCVGCTVDLKPKKPAVVTLTILPSALEIDAETSEILLHDGTRRIQLTGLLSQEQEGQP